MKTVVVTTPSASYPIYIGEDLVLQIHQQLQDCPVYQRCTDILLVSNETVFPLYGGQVESGLTSGGKRVHSYILPDGEQYKTWEQAEAVLTFALKNRLSRHTVLLALGGGVVGDLAGFVASIYLRGIPFIQVPTTLLAQVDSSVGGKVAVNHSLGKNMIGSFYHPQAVIADVHTLHSLPQREWLSGLAEVIKHAIIWDNQFYSLLVKDQQQVLSRDNRLLVDIVAKNCIIKAGVVGEDETEQGLRAILNFGHTVGHALERMTDYQRYRHGEAVSIGMVAACQLAYEHGMLSATDRDGIRSLLADWGLPVALPDVDLDQIVQGIGSDKKTVGDNITFILPDRIGHAKIVQHVELDIIRRSLGAMEKEK